MNSISFDLTKDLDSEDLNNTYEFFHAVGSEIVESAKETRIYKLAEGTAHALKETALFFYDFMRGPQPIPPGTFTQERLFQLPEPRIRVHPRIGRPDPNFVPRQEKIMPILKANGWVREGDAVSIHREASLTYRVAQLLYNEEIKIPQN